MEDEYQIKEYQEENTERPKFLLVLCIMTILNAGITLVNGLFSLFSGKPSEVEIAKVNSQISKSLDLLIDQEMYYWVDVIKKVQIMSEAMYTNFTTSITISIIISLCGLLAAIFMLKGKKIGFHAYIIYSFLWILQSYLFEAPQNVPSVLVIFNVLFCAGFVYMYSRNLKCLR
jgi:hypothetical protein